MVHNHGPFLQEDAFYPFGVTMAGISSKAAGGIENKYKFNSGSELNNDLDIGIYETPLRGYDAQIGRFEQSSDPMASVYNCFSNYAFVGNNPVIYSDPTGAYRAALNYVKPNRDDKGWGKDPHHRKEEGYTGEAYLDCGIVPTYSGDAATMILMGIREGRISIDAASLGIVTCKMVSDYLAIKYPDLDNISVTETSGYSERGEGFKYGGFTKDESGYNNIAQSGFLSMKVSNSLMAPSRGEGSEGESGGFETAHTIIDGADNTVRISIEKGFDAAYKVSPSTIFKTGAKVSKYTGRALGIIGIGLSVYQGTNNPKGWQISNTIDVVIGTAAFIPVAGEFIGVGWFVANLVSIGINGKPLSENIQDKFESMNQ